MKNDDTTRLQISAIVLAAAIALVFPGFANPSSSIQWLTSILFFMAIGLGGYIFFLAIAYAPKFKFKSKLIKIANELYKVGIMLAILFFVVVIVTEVPGFIFGTLKKTIQLDPLSILIAIAFLAGLSIPYSLGNFFFESKAD